MIDPYSRWRPAWPAPKADVPDALDRLFGRDPDGELLAVLERSGWSRISIQRRSEIVREMARVCDETENGNAEAWRRRDDGAPRLVVGYWQPVLHH